VSFNPQHESQRPGRHISQIQCPLGVTDYFTPYDQLKLAKNDLDLGSGSGMLLPSQKGKFPDEIITAGNEGLRYVVNRSNKGKFDAQKNRVIETVCGSATCYWAARPIGTTQFIIRGRKIFSASTLRPTVCFPGARFIKRPRSSFGAVRLAFQPTDRPTQECGRLRKYPITTESCPKYCTPTMPRRFPKSCTTRIRRERATCSDPESPFYPHRHERGRRMWARVVSPDLPNFYCARLSDTECCSVRHGIRTVQRISP